MKILSLLWLKTQVPIALTTNNSHVCSCSAKTQGRLPLLYPFLFLTSNNGMPLSSIDMYTMSLIVLPSLREVRQWPWSPGNSLSFIIISDYPESKLSWEWGGGCYSRGCSVDKWDHPDSPRHSSETEEWPAPPACPGSARWTPHKVAYLR